MRALTTATALSAMLLLAGCNSGQEYTEDSRTAGDPGTASSRAAAPDSSPSASTDIGTGPSSPQSSDPATAPGDQETSVSTGPTSTEPTRTEPASDDGAAAAAPGYAAQNGFTPGEASTMSGPNLKGTKTLPGALNTVAFVSPSGNIACRISGDGALCQIKEKTYQVPTEDTETPGCDTGLAAQHERQGFICGDGDLGFEADITGENVKWWNPALGSQKRDWAGTEYEAAVLPYGHSIDTHQAQCRMDYEGVTCWTESAKDGQRAALFLSKTKYLTAK